MMSTAREVTWSGLLNKLDTEEKTKSLMCDTV